MAALLLSAAGAAAGSALFGPLGAIAGRIAGALAGNLIDQALLASPRHVEGPRRADLDVTASTEGAPIPRLYGRGRISGQVIWATKLEEVISERDEGAGGKGLGPRVTTTTYSYFANIAIGLGEGEVAHVGRIWADGKPLDLDGVTWRFYRGSETQEPDPLIVAKEGGDNAPAYRGLAYIVFERLPLENFGNRIPQFSFEVIRPVGRLEGMVRAVTLIPGSTEFGYAPFAVSRVLGPGQSASENRHVAHAASDIVASLDELQALCPLLERVAVVVTWFGNDLRAGACTLRPGIDQANKSTHGASWSVAGATRENAHLVTQIDGRAAFGGTPSDQSVVRLIQELHARGLEVTLYPFIMMDIPADNALENPLTGMAPQPAFPWRGRITCHPAPGIGGSPDGTSAAAQQVEALFGSAQPAHFSVAGEVVSYAGPAEWTLRRMILHYAHLAVAAGGVEAFVIGSEMLGLTRVRAEAGVYPATAQLVALAADAKSVLGPAAKVTYAADWTEYGAHVVDAAAQELRFPLDPLWASDAIDMIGIDYYAPLADWRDGAQHLDRTVAPNTYDLGYLKANLSGGEGYDWYYADEAARAAQARAPITDGAARKPWVFRVKDLWNFWASAHHERVGGEELPSPTAWIPQSKPIWLTEVGCPAVDKGANAPNVFPDPKSSDGGFPHFSNRGRDDLMQRRYLEAVLSGFDPAFGASDAHNPVSPLYGGRMIAPGAIHLWTWDARPYPAFPAALDVWSDGGNWETGHWLTGRFGGTPMRELVAAILQDAGVESVDTEALLEGPDGYLIDRPMTPRAAIDPLTLAYAFDAIEHGEGIAFRMRGGDVVAELSEDDLVPGRDGGPALLARAQETELPREISIAYSDTGADFRRSAALSRRLVGGAARTAHADLAIATSDAAAARRAGIWLQDLWAGRESAEFALPPSRLALTAGDLVAVTVNGRARILELREVVDAGSRRLKARSIDPAVFEHPLSPPRWRAPPSPPSLAPVHAVTLDLPALPGEEPPVLTRAAVFARPWPGAVTIWRGAGSAGFEVLAQVRVPAVMGETLDTLPRGPAGRWDNAGGFRVKLYGGALASLSDEAVLGGANAAALRRADGAWEVLQFAQAVLVGERTYLLSRLLRGQAGSEWAMHDALPAGSAFVKLDAHLVPLARGLDALGRPLSLRLTPAGRDHADPATLALEVTPGATALRPLAPVHVRARRSAEGATIAWIRRTRRDGDSWDAPEVPLGEDIEAYEVDILEGGEVVRTLASSTPHALYANAQELADFGAPQSALSLRVYQLSATVGRGFAAEAVVECFV